jgi:hypothetical protein
MSGVSLTVAASPELPVVTLKATDLLPAHNIRTAGIDEEHVRLLMSCGENLPPLLVQKSTFRVIDGMHRLRAAQAAGRNEIHAQLWDIDDQDAFLYGISANVRHGLPLSLTDRRAAAQKILELRPDWSDRAIARAAGLSGKTVGALRTRGDLSLPALTRRIGLDGKVRPVQGAIASAVQKTMDTATSSVCTTTAPDEPVVLGASHAKLDKLRSTSENNHTPSSGRSTDNVETILAKLRKDPSLKYNPSGRGLLRLMHQRPTRTLRKDVMEALPGHWMAKVAALARAYASEWLEIAEELEEAASRNP